MRFFFSVFVLLLLPLFSQVKSQKHLDIAQSFIGTKELTGHNDGAEVEMFLNSVGRKKGESWCSAFVSFCLSSAKVRAPTTRSGLARSFKLQNKIIPAVDVLRGTKKISKGSIIGWEKGNTVFGHIGFTFTSPKAPPEADWSGPYGTTIEGNTSSGLPAVCLAGAKGNQFDGDGVYLRSRVIQPANYFRICWFILVRS